MTVQITGGCACGAIRYTCNEQPIATLNCHCQDCQRSSGAPFASGIVVRSFSHRNYWCTQDLHRSPATQEEGRLVASVLSAEPRSSPAGEAVSEFMSIRFPTLDDPSWFKPALDILDFTITALGMPRHKHSALP